MNNAPLTLILIASLGIVAVISLGVFFAVRPKFAGTEEHLAADFVDQSPVDSQDSSSPSESFPNAAHKQQESSSSNITPRPWPTQPPGGAAQPSAMVSFDRSSPAGPAQPAPASKQNGDHKVGPGAELLDSLRLAAPGETGQEQDVRAVVNVNPTSPATTPTVANVTSSPRPISLRELVIEREIDIHRYGKVVGLAYRNGKIYVPSYQNGNISVYRSESMNMIREYSCGGCRIYDMGVLANGDMVISQGKYSKLTKLDGKTGNIVKEITVPYSTKGMAVSNYDEIFVLSRDHNAIYVYDAELKQLGSVPISNKEKNDCNFLSYASDKVYVSCESAVHVINVEGEQIQTLKPSQGTYAIGIAVNWDKDGKVYAGKRGTRVVDVFDKDGNYLESIGEKKDSIWSDIAVAGKYLYVIEYITATIKQYRL